uniref:Uncharacterized protein n=1 Tax=Anguilla anguilla TaxID=7936 RepID=A0A0E9P9K5_ANGAN
MASVKAEVREKSFNVVTFYRWNLAIWLPNDWA